MKLRFIDRLERRFGQFAIPQLTRALIIIQVLAFVLGMDNPELLGRLVLLPSAVLAGEYWRLLTLWAVPPTTNLLFAFFFWWFFYIMGTALEQFWGAFQYNLFLMMGYVATVAAAFITPTGEPVTNGFLFSSIFLAFAYLNPDFVILLFFILPVKIKWLALLTWISYGLTFLLGSWPVRLTVLASIANFALFFGPEIFRWARVGQRRMVQQAKEIGRRNEPFHRCQVCGITDQSNPNIEFRYCSQCMGACCYCPDHIRNHEHVTAKTPDA